MLDGLRMGEKGWDFVYSAGVQDEEFVRRKIKLSDRWYKLIFDMIKLAGLTFSSEKTTFLEVGCGVGGLCIWASRECKDVTGLDVVKSGLKLGNVLSKTLKSNVSFTAGDARSLPFKDESYDVVICTETLEHIPNYRKAFEELVRVAKKSGYIIITVPNYINMRLYFLFSMRSCLTGKSLQPDDVNFFSISVINRLFERKDLRVLIKRGVGLVQIPSNRRKIRSLERRLDRSFDKLKFLCMNIGVVAQKIS